MKVANNLGMVQLQQELGQMLFYYNPHRQSSTSYWATHVAKKYILPLTRRKQLPRFFFFCQIGQHLAISTVCVMPTAIPHAIKKNEIQERSRVNPAHQAEHVTRTQTSDKAVRPSLIYQKYYILRLQAFTGSHSSLLKHPIGTGKEGRKRQPDMGIQISLSMELSIKQISSNHSLFRLLQYLFAIQQHVKLCPLLLFMATKPLSACLET